MVEGNPFSYNAEESNSSIKIASVQKYVALINTDQQMPARETSSTPLSEPANPNTVSIAHYLEENIGNNTNI